MEDRFIFRAWDTKNEIMVYDNEDKSEDYWDGVVSSKVGMVNYLLTSLCGAYTLMQCTGLKDENGKLIFEGDILQDQYGTMFQVLWLDDSWCVKGDILSGDSLSLYNFGCEIIGNIYNEAGILFKKQES